MIFTADNIQEYQIEVTTYCNAACPQCPRNINGGSINPHMPLLHLDRQVLDRAFNHQVMTNIKQVFFCGSYGDPLMHPEFLDICRDFRNKNPQVWIYLHSNGGGKSPEWWADLAKIINGYGKVDFGIDGLEDTNHIYRRNVDWQSVTQNTSAFIKAGGQAQWNFIVFKHNQHQIDQAQQISKHMGFKSFLPRRTGRFFHHGSVEELTQWPVMNRQGDIEYYLEPSTLPEFKNPSVQRINFIKQSHGTWHDYLNSTAITCDAALGKKLVITAEGLVLPCNFFEHNLYDARFFDDTYLPGANQWSRSQGANQIKNIVEQFGKNNLNINHAGIEEILQNQFWRNLESSWHKDFNNGRIFECAHTCGEKFTKVWDQGGSIR